MSKKTTPTSLITYVVTCDVGGTFFLIILQHALPVVILKNVVKKITLIIVEKL